MGLKFLIDTNAIVDLLGDRLPEKGSNWLQEVIDNHLHCISVINQIELLSFNGTSEEMKVINDFVNATIILPLSDDIVAYTINLRRQKKINLHDAIIASTATIHYLDIITKNEDDFQDLDDLFIINPHLT